jgi:hypothetical protein
MDCQAIDGRMRSDAQVDQFLSGPHIAISRGDRGDPSFLAAFHFHPGSHRIAFAFCSYQLQLHKVAGGCRVVTEQGSRPIQMGRYQIDIQVVVEVD